MTVLKRYNIIFNLFLLSEGNAGYVFDRGFFNSTVKSLLVKDIVLTANGLWQSEEAIIIIIIIIISLLVHMSNARVYFTIYETVENKEFTQT